MQCRAMQRVGSLTHDGGLAKAKVGCLVDSLVGQSARARHNANAALGVDVSEGKSVSTAKHRLARGSYPGIMPILHSPGLMIPGQLGPAQRTTGQVTSQANPRNIACRRCCNNSSMIALHDLPMSLVLLPFMWFLAITMSFWGIPSVIHTTRSISASTALRR